MARKAQDLTTTNPGRTVSEDLLREIVRRVVEAAKPERIILFGLAARGGMGRTAI
jgi:hypothetical protein